MRLPIDRSFTLRGIGTVVTGTLWSGSVRAADRLAIMPSGREVRVRSVQVHDAPVETAAAGQRVAVALVGVDRDQVARGDTLAAPGSLTAGYRLECEVTGACGRAARAAKRGAGHGAPCHHRDARAGGGAGRRRHRAGPDRAGAAAAAAADRGTGGRSCRDPADGPAGDGGGRVGDRPGTLAQRPRAGAATAGGCTRHARAFRRGRATIWNGGWPRRRSLRHRCGRTTRAQPRTWPTRAGSCAPARSWPSRGQRSTRRRRRPWSLRPSTGPSPWPSYATALAAPAATHRRCSRRSTRTA